MAMKLITCSTIISSIFKTYNQKFIGEEGEVDVRKVKEPLAGKRQFPVLVVFYLP